jgi:hypothetical protein
MVLRAQVITDLGMGVGPASALLGLRRHSDETAPGTFDRKRCVGDSIARPMDETGVPTTANRQLALAGTVMLAIVPASFWAIRHLVAPFPPDLDAFLQPISLETSSCSSLRAHWDRPSFRFTGMLARGQRAAAWRLASSLANILLVVLSLLALISAVFAPAIVRYLLAPGFSADPTQFALTVELLRIQLASVVLFGIGGLLVGILNAHNRFFIPALTPSMPAGPDLASWCWAALGIRGRHGAWSSAGLYVLLRSSLLESHVQAIGVSAGYIPTFGLGLTSAAGLPDAAASWNRRGAGEFLGSTRGWPLRCKAEVSPDCSTGSP